MQDTQIIKNLCLDLEALKKDARRVNNKIIKLYAEQIGQENFFYKEKYYKILGPQLANAPLTSKLHDYYNVFHFPYKELYELYRKICIVFNEHKEHNQIYYLHAWLNYQYQGEPIPAHAHWKGLFDLDECYYASFYIDAEPSTTFFKFPDGTVIEKANKNNTLCLSKDLGDAHWVDPWQGSTPRITISMNIIPQKYLQTSPFSNTWIPII